MKHPTRSTLMTGRYPNRTEVLGALDEMKIRDNTLIIFSSDNGGPQPGVVTSNGPLGAGKGTIHEGGIRVCACVNWPGHIPTGKTIDEPLHAVDWYPTLAKLSGALVDQKLPLDGLDIWPVLTEGAKSPHEALILNGTKRGQAAIRMGDWKLLIGAGGKAKEAEQLYHSQKTWEKRTTSPPPSPRNSRNCAPDMMK